MKAEDFDASVNSWPFWKASILCALAGGAIGAFLTLVGM